jgi:hypothetical protein
MSFVWEPGRRAQLGSLPAAERTGRASLDRTAEGGGCPHMGLRRDYGLATTLGNLFGPG